MRVSESIPRLLPHGVHVARADANGDAGVTRKRSASVRRVMRTPISDTRGASIPLRSARLVRHIGIVGIAGVVTGVLVGGGGSRLVMLFSRLLSADVTRGLRTEAGNVVGEVTLGGSLALVVFVGLFAGGSGAITYLITEPWLQWAGRWYPGVFSLVLFALSSFVILVPDNIDFFILGNAEINVAMFSFLFVAFGLLLCWLVPRLSRRLPAVRAHRLPTSTAAYAALLLPGGLFVAASVATYVSDSACGCAAPLLLGGLVLITAVLTLVVWIAEIGSATGGWLIGVRLAGHLSLAAATAVGLIGAFHNITEIL